MTPQPPTPATSSSFSPRLPHLVSPLVLAGLAAYVAWANFWYVYDDAFITYRVAHNFATGQGFVYNPGEWSLGTTAPGLGLLLGIAGHVFGADTIPLLGGVVTSVSLALAGFALYVYGARHDHAVGGLLAGLLLIANQMMAVTFGGEMPLQIALVLWAFVAYDADRRIACALLLAAASVVRPDGVLAAIVIGVIDLVRTRRIDWRAWLAFALALLPFVALAWLYYGSPIPVTLAAKLAQRDTGLWPTFGRGLRQWLHIFLGVNGRPAGYEIFSWDPRALGFWVVVGTPALLWYRFWWPPLVWALTFTMSYRTLRVPFYHWYAAPVVVGLAIVAAAGIEGVLALLVRLTSRASRSGAGPAVVAAAAGVALCLAINLDTLRGQQIWPQQPVVQLYEQAGQWLEAHTAPTATIGYFEIGHLGYYAHRPVIDPLGLLDPAVPPHVAQRDFLWAYRQHPPTYILEQEGHSYGGILSETWFTRDYRPIRIFTDPANAHVSLTIFERVADPRTTR